MQPRARTISTTKSRRDFGDLTPDEQSVCEGVYARGDKVFNCLGSLKSTNPNMLLAPLTGSYIDGGSLVIPIQNLTDMSSQRELWASIRDASMSGEDIDLAWGKHPALKLVLPGTRVTLASSPCRNIVLGIISVFVVWVVYTLLQVLSSKSKFGY